MRSVIPERFALVKLLKEDRYAKVFLANDDLLGRENVVVKIIRKERVRYSGDRLFEHFSWWIGIEHPEFALVLDAGLTTQQHLYFVREYLPQSQLFSLDSVAVIRTLLSAASFLSQHNRVHGAIKPSNIFATKEVFKIADSNTFSEPTSPNETEAIHFTAPEILMGGDANHESDLYSIGAVVHRILTGRHIFDDSDPSRLKWKYLSAAPHSTSYISAHSDPILQQVLKLVSRNPADRMPALDRLKRILGFEALKPNQAPFMGRKPILQKLVTAAQMQALRLRVVLLEGENGIGQTRFLEEMRLLCAFRGIAFVGHQCVPDARKPAFNQESIQVILQKAVKAISSKDYRAKPIVVDRLEGSSLEQRKYPAEKTINDAVSFLAFLAQKNRLVIAFDDIDSAELGISTFLNVLAYRASEVPLTLILTKKPSELDLDLVRKIDACVGDDFTRVRLPALSEHESVGLVQFLERDPDRQSHILQLSSGNPLFINAYCQCQESLDVAPQPVIKAADSMLSRMTRETQAVLRLLSVFRTPIQLATLAMLSKKDPCELDARLNEAMQVGLVKRLDELVGLSYAATRSILYASIRKKQRVQLNRIVLLIRRTPAKI